MRKGALFCSILGLLLGFGGCRRADPPPYPDWLPSREAYTPREGSSNAFDAYAAASLEVERLAPEAITRVHFTPGMKAGLQRRLSSALSKVRRGTALACAVEFRAVAPNEPRPYEAGWRMLGRALQWHIEDAVLADDYDRAISALGAAMKFGFDISGAGATAASLGYTIVDDCRNAIAPALGRMGAGQLGALAEQARAALRRHPEIAATVQREYENMLAAVQHVQDRYRNNELPEIKRELGPSVRGAVQFLEGLRDESPEERARYFADFAAEAGEERDYILRASAMPPAERASYSYEPSRTQRPWGKLAQHYFQTLRPLPAVRDRTLARTRLLALSALAIRSVKASRAAPKSIEAFPRDLTVDPYRGEPFIYWADGMEFRVYSVGDNFQDDGGETDSRGLRPDLVLSPP
jgi:hypothetical protein